MSKEAEIIGDLFEMPHVWRWTRERFNAAADAGAFDTPTNTQTSNPVRLELIRGVIYEKMQQHPPHATTLTKSDDEMRIAFGRNHVIRLQLPLILSTDGQPEPDVLVVPGKPDDYSDHPTASDVLLLIEVSDTTLAFDQGTKSELYAEAGIAEYWIINIKERVLEVRRDPHGKRYRSLRIYEEEESVAPLAKADITIAVKDLLPK
jgi:Uma2 family endonuclease